MLPGRSREGAWIEIVSYRDLFGKSLGVAPVRERGLKYNFLFGFEPFSMVAPVRERGLKSDWLQGRD